jgi:CDP-6-deoxy-D-xylo-4-hexulose-3-dehydrase
VTNSPKATSSTAAYRLAAETIGPAEIQAAKDALDSGFLTMGQRVRRFEREFAEWIGMDHAVMVNSGSSANLLMVDALLRSTGRSPRLVPGDEVIVPGLAWPTTVWPLAQLGLVPVFVDVDPETLAISLGSAEAAMGPRTRGLFLIHPLGRAIDLLRYAEFCEERGLVLLEDCCESLGAHWAGAHVGTAGLSASFSFYFSHHVSTIEGGMMATNDAGLADDLRGLRAHGWIRDRADGMAWAERHPDLDPRFLFATVGYNVRPTEIQAAIGSVQLTRLDEMLAAREALARDVHAMLAEFAPWLELIGGEILGEGASPSRRGRRHSWMTLPLRVRADAPVDRDALVGHLEQRGIETRPIIAGNLALHPAVGTVEHRRAADMRHCDALLRRSLMIGCHPVLPADSRSALEDAVAGLASL